MVFQYRPRHYRTIMSHVLTGLRIDIRRAYEEGKAVAAGVTEDKQGRPLKPFEMDDFAAFVRKLKDDYFAYLDELQRDALQQHEGDGDRQLAIRAAYDDRRTRFTHEMHKALHAATHAVSAVVPVGQQAMEEVPDIRDEALQLLWGATLAYVDANIAQYFPPPPPPSSGPFSARTAAKDTIVRRIDHTPLWHQVAAAQEARTEMAAYTGYLLRHGVKMDARINDQTTLSWGLPKSWFFFSPEYNHVNLDLMFSLMAGFGNARPIVFHELGHSQLTVGFPPRVEELSEQIREIKEEYKDKSIPKELYIRLRKMEFELQQRMALWNPAEDNCVNAFANMMGEVLGHPHAANMNNNKMTIAGHGQIVRESVQAAEKGEPYPAMPADEKDLHEALFENISRAVNLVFFMNNGLFSDRSEEWRRMGMDPDWLFCYPGGDDQPPIQGRAAQERLLDWCGLRGMDVARHPLAMERGLMNLRPTPEEYETLTEDELRARVHAYSEARNEIIDRIWDEYVAHLHRAMEKRLEQQIEEQLAKGGQQGGPGEGTMQVDTGDGEGGTTPMPGVADPQGQPQPGGPGKKRGRGRGRPGGRGGDGDPGEQETMHFEEVDLTIDTELDFEQMIAKLRPEIDEVKKQLRAIREAQAQSYRDVTEEYYRLTPGGGASTARSLDKNRPVQRARKIAGGSISISDFGDFRGMKDVDEPPAIDIGIKIDGSGSMSGSGAFEEGNRQDRLTLAWLSLIILFVGADELNREERNPFDPPFNVFANMWGTDNPVTIATPDMTVEEVRQNIIKYRGGLGSTTKYQYAVQHMSHMLSEFYEGRSGPVGASHLFVISDGDISDYSDGKAPRTAHALLDRCPTVTLDAILVDQDSTDSNLHKLVRGLNGQDPTHRDYALGDDRQVYLEQGTGWDAIHRGIIRVMERRAEQMRESVLRFAQDAGVKWLALQEAEQQIAALA